MRAEAFSAAVTTFASELLLSRSLMIVSDSFSKTANSAAARVEAKPARAAASGN